MLLSPPVLAGLGALVHSPAASLCPCTAYKYDHERHDTRAIPCCTHGANALMQQQQLHITPKIAASNSWCDMPRPDTNRCCHTMKQGMPHLPDRASRRLALNVSCSAYAGRPFLQHHVTLIFITFLSVLSRRNVRIATTKMSPSAGGCVLCMGDKYPCTAQFALPKGLHLLPHIAAAAPCTAAIHYSGGLHLETCSHAACRWQ